MGKTKKILLIFTAFIVLLFAAGTTAFATTLEEDGLAVAFVADKDEYGAKEQIITKLTVKNTNRKPVTGILITAMIPQGYEFAEESDAVQRLDVLEAGEMVTLTVAYAPEPNKAENSLAVILGVGLLLGLAIAFTAFVFWMEKKKGKTEQKGKKILSVLLCIGMLGAELSICDSIKAAAPREFAKQSGATEQDPVTATALADASAPSGAERPSDSAGPDASDAAKGEIPLEQERKTIRIGATVRVAGEEILLSAEIAYQPAKEEKYSVDIAASYGGVIAQGISGEYIWEEEIVLEAVPEDGWLFLGWESSDGGEFADPKNRKTSFFVPEHDTTLIAKFIKEDWTEFSDDEIDVYLAYCALEIGYWKGDYSGSVLHSLTLPSSCVENEHAVAIEWRSSKEEIVSAQGEVRRPLEADEPVTLTAFLSKGAALAEKEFQITVKKASEYTIAEIEEKTAIDLEEWNEEAEYPLEIDYSDDGTQVTFISGKYSDIPVDSVEAALQSIYSVKSLIGLSNPSEELVWQATNHDGITLSYTFSQIYQGIPVYGASVTVNADEGSKEARALSSSIVPSGQLSNVSLTPELSVDEISERYNEDFAVLDATLIIYLLHERSNEPVVAYFLTAEQERIIVDAGNGELLLRFPIIFDWGDYSTTGRGTDELGNAVTFPVQFHQWDFWFYYLEDVRRKIVIQGDQTGPITHEFNTEWKDRTAISAYTNVIKVYDWYKEHLGRNSIDNNGMRITVNVHNYKKEKDKNTRKEITNNAHWDGGNEEICFFENSGGGTPTTAAGLDIIAHEMTHGVFQKILGDNGVNNFPYRGYTGSINEGYADVFGCFVDNEDWQMGEDWIELRDLADPGKHNAPSKLNGEHYYTGDNQSTLVHTNSSLVSHAAYLMHTYGITGSKLEKLWYNSMSQGYTESATFHTVRRNLIQAAKNNSFADEELAKVRKAFDTEEIYDERGSLTICFVDETGAPVSLEEPLVVAITLKRDRKDVPEFEYSMFDAIASEAGTEHEMIYFGNYEVEIEIPGYSDFQGRIKIVKNKNTELAVPLIEEGNGTIGGVVTSATTGYPVDLVALKIYPGWNQKSGEVIAEGFTGAEGGYSVELPAGFYTMELSKEEYVTGYLNIIAIGGKEVMDQNASISPVMVLGNDFRVVLTWGQNPSDLDSHLFGAFSNGSSYHVFYRSRNGYDKNGEPVANLDVDDTTSYGPETVTFRSIGGGSYQYYVNWYSGSGTWATSGGKVEVYNGDRLIQVFQVPSVDSSAGSWKVFGLVNGIFIPYNIIQETNIY